MNRAEPMPYDPTREALFRPESQPSIPIDPSVWPVDAICAELSRLAYIRFEEGQEQVLRDALSTAGFDQFAMFNAGGSQAFAAKASDGSAYIAFRGTQADKKEDLIADAKFLPLDWRAGGRVHRGFAEALEAVLGEIEDWIGNQAPQRLILTGHSLGASLATLLASLHPKAELVTFGSPRVGNAAFAKLFAARNPRRYVGCCDLVTRVPPLILGFRHAGPRLYLDRAGNLSPPSISMLKVFIDRMAARTDFIRRYLGRPGNAPARELSDHAPINYVSGVLGRRGFNPPQS
jgi:triacylglycerol lipase